MKYLYKIDESYLKRHFANLIEVEEYSNLIPEKGGYTETEYFNLARDYEGDDTVIVHLDNPLSITIFLDYLTTKDFGKRPAIEVVYNGHIFNFSAVGYANHKLRVGDRLIIENDGTLMYGKPPEPALKK